MINSPSLLLRIAHLIKLSNYSGHPEFFSGAQARDAQLYNLWVKSTSIPLEEKDLKWWTDALVRGFKFTTSQEETSSHTPLTKEQQEIANKELDNEEFQTGVKKEVLKKKIVNGLLKNYEQHSNLGAPLREKATQVLNKALAFKTKDLKYETLFNNLISEYPKNEIIDFLSSISQALKSIEAKAKNNELFSEISSKINQFIEAFLYDISELGDIEEGDLDEEPEEEIETDEDAGDEDDDISEFLVDQSEDGYEDEEITDRKKFELDANSESPSITVHGVTFYATGKTWISIMAQAVKDIKLAVKGTKQDRALEDLFNILTNPDFLEHISFIKPRGSDPCSFDWPINTSSGMGVKKYNPEGGAPLDAYIKANHLRAAKSLLWKCYGKNIKSLVEEGPEEGEPMEGMEQTPGVEDPMQGIGGKFTGFSDDEQKQLNNLLKTEELGTDNFHYFGNTKTKLKDLTGQIEKIKENLKEDKVDILSSQLNNLSVYLKEFANTVHTVPLENYRKKVTDLARIFNQKSAELEKYLPQLKDPTKAKSQKKIFKEIQHLLDSLELEISQETLSYPSAIEKYFLAVQEDPSFLTEIKNFLTPPEKDNAQEKTNYQKALRAMYSGGIGTRTNNRDDHPLSVINLIDQKLNPSSEKNKIQKVDKGDQKSKIKRLMGYARLKDLLALYGYLTPEGKVSPELVTNIGETNKYTPQLEDAGIPETNQPKDSVLGGIIDLHNNGKFKNLGRDIQVALNISKPTSNTLSKVIEKVQDLLMTVSEDNPLYDRLKHLAEEGLKIEAEKARKEQVLKEIRKEQEAPKALPKTEMPVADITRLLQERLKQLKPKDDTGIEI